MQQTSRKTTLTRIPVLPLRGMMVFPHMVLHFDVGRVKSVAALEKAMLEDQKIFSGCAAGYRYRRSNA